MSEEEGDVLIPQDDPDKLRYYLLGKPVANGDRLELLHEDGTWTAGRFEWDGRRRKRPELWPDVTKGERQYRLSLAYTVVLRWPSKEKRAALATLIGYMRVSTLDQNPDLQRDALKQAGCGKIFSDTKSGKDALREGLKEALEYLRPGDTLVVWKLDRLGRSLKDLIEIVQTLQGKGIGFKSLQESIDTTTSSGKLIFHVFAALAEFERDIIRERTHAGLTAARARGRQGGRPRKMDDRKIRTAEKLLSDPEKSISEICKTLGIARSTLYRHRGKETVREEPEG